MYSFYGGKEGRTYNIVNHYDSIYQMVLNFQQGGSHTDANYNEYVIIDTLINRNKKHDRENGILYRRGLNFNEQFDPQNILDGDPTHTLNENKTIDEAITLYGYAGVTYLDTDEIEYQSGMLQLSTSNVPKYKHYEYILTEADGEVVAEIHPRDFIIHEGSDYSEFQLDWVNFVTNPGGGAIYVGQIVGPQGESPELDMVDWDTFEEEYLHSDTTDPAKGEIEISRRPGFTTEGGYADDVKYGWCNIRDEQNNIYGAVLAFDMPYTVFKYNVHSVSAYGPTIIPVTVLPEEEFVNKSAYYYIETEDSYYIWDDTRTVVDSTSAAGYKYEPGFVKTDVWAVSQDDEGVWHYTDMLREQAESQGHPFFGSYEIAMPRGIHGQDVLLEMYNQQSGHSPEPDREYDLMYTITNYDSLTDGEEGLAIETKLCTLKVIKNTAYINSQEEAGQTQPASWIRINYYTDEFDDIAIKRIESISMDNKGVLKANYVTGNEYSGQGQQQEFATLKYITNTALNGDQELVITYNTENDNPGTKDTTNLGLQLKVISKIGIENERKLNGVKNFYYQYDVGDKNGADHGKHYPNTAKIDLSDSINEIADIKLYGDNIVVLYSDPTIRHNIPSNKLIKMPYDGVTGWDGSVPDETDTSTSPATKLFYWQNLGPILNGEHIFGHYTRIEDLQERYPNGFTGNYAGWVATITTGSGANTATSLYAYDYNGSRGWYEISSVAMNQVEPKSIMIMSEGQDGAIAPQYYDSYLQDQGYWFVEEDIQIATEIN